MEEGEVGLAEQEVAGMAEVEEEMAEVAKAKEGRGAMVGAGMEGGGTAVEIA